LLSASVPSRSNATSFFIAAQSIAATSLHEG